MGSGSLALLYLYFQISIFVIFLGESRVAVPLVMKSCKIGTLFVCLLTGWPSGIVCWPLGLADWLLGLGA